MPPRLGEHLEAHCVLPVLYASSWFLTCFASDFPIAFAARVLDVVICDCYAAPMMKVGEACRRAGLACGAGRGGWVGQVWGAARRTVDYICTERCLEGAGVLFKAARP